MDSKIIKCSNCGAEIKESDTKCPYCGYINEEGAEKEYMEKLYDIRSSLDEVDKEAASGYGRDYGRIFKLIAITVSVLIIAAGAVYLISRFSESRRVTSDPAKSDDLLKEMAWKKEAFSEFDRMYEQGEYDKLCEMLFSSNKGEHDVYSWQHYWFAHMYNDYLLTVRDFERIDKEGFSEYDAGIIFYRCSYFYYEELYRNDNKYSGSLTDEEVEKLQPAIDYMNGILKDRLGFTDEDMAGFKGELIGKYNELVYDRCMKVGKEHMKQFK